MAATPAHAQAWPTGRVTIVVPFPAGAATDISARVYAERLSVLWGQPVVIDNKGGGNGIPAAETVGRAKPDGLTLFATSAMTQAVNPAIYETLPYDPIESFEPITRMVTSPFVLLVAKNSPITSAAELTARLKSEPGKHNFGAGALPARVAPSSTRWPPESRRSMSVTSPTRRRYPTCRRRSRRACPTCC